ncbi:hypothetical protein [Actinoplanes sp. L3-i22]|uniref:hypothetical protein n=1 Tax=Actinoplanes sp. L3-i22 TaxID=2836373 RepID=UPI001C76FF60|nr:hypothetical protein [Actinoplanes sp. L3-i22]BCY13137.1 hypothetical protein L3i22_082250 [Actinoplanes sp. L3-i22]
MRTLMRAGVVALAAGSVVLGGGVAAQAAPAGKISVSVNRLILDPGAPYGHTGSVQVLVKNTTAEPYNGGIILTEPIAGTFDWVNQVGAEACGLAETADHRDIQSCSLSSAVQPGTTSVITLAFKSTAKPQPYAQIAPELGTVEVAGKTASFGAVFRSTKGKTTNPRPYVQDTVAKLSVTATDATLTRQEDGTFAGHSTVTLHSDGDAKQHDLNFDVATPNTLDPWPRITPEGPCVGGSTDFPVPADYNTEGCLIFSRIAEGETQTYDVTVTAPAEATAGAQAPGIVRFTLNGGPGQTDSANIANFGVTIAG